MTRTRALFLSAAMAGCLSFSSVPMARAQEFKTTPAKEVAANPQRFWARGVVFRDTLTEVASGKGATRIADRKAYPFSTKVVGTCYADESILPALRELPLNNEYIFTATVYSDKVGFIRRKTRYLILVSGVMAPASNIGALATDVEAALERAGGAHFFAPPLAALREMMVRIQAAMTADAETGGYPRSEFFDPKSEHFDKLEQIVRRAVAEIENETKIPAREHFIMALRSLIALKEGAFAQSADAQPAPAAEEPAPVKEDTPASPQEATRSKLEPTIPTLRLTVQAGRSTESEGRPDESTPVAPEAQPVAIRAGDEAPPDSPTPAPAESTP